MLMQLVQRLQVPYEPFCTDVSVFSAQNMLHGKLWVMRTSAPSSPLSSSVARRPSLVVSFAPHKGKPVLITSGKHGLWPTGLSNTCLMVTFSTRAFWLRGASENLSLDKSKGGAFGSVVALIALLCALIAPHDAGLLLTQSADGSEHAQTPKANAISHRKRSNMLRMRSWGH